MFAFFYFFKINLTNLFVFFFSVIQNINRLVRDNVLYKIKFVESFEAAVTPATKYPRI